MRQEILLQSTGCDFSIFHQHDSNNRGAHLSPALILLLLLLILLPWHYYLVLFYSLINLDNWTVLYVLLFCGVPFGETLRG